MSQENGINKGKVPSGMGQASDTPTDCSVHEFAPDECSQAVGQTAQTESLVQSKSILDNLIHR
jgi:hypothetical protein